MIAGEIAAVEKRNRELSIVGVEAVALAQHPRRRTQLQMQVPQFLRKAANGVFERLLRVAISKKKKQIDVGIRKQPSPAESSRGDQSEVGRLGRFERNDIAPQPCANVFTQPCALPDSRA